jgi:integrase
MAIVKRKNRNGTYTYQVKVKDPAGNWYPTPGFSVLDDAEAEELRLKGLKRKGSLAFSQDGRTVTFAQYWEVWIEENCKKTSEGWKKSLRQQWRDYIEPVAGDLKMREIDTPVIGRILNRMIDLELSEQTRLHVYNQLNQMLGDAVEYYEMIPANPVKRKFHRPKVIQKVRNFLPPAEAWQLIAGAQAHEYLGPPVTFGILGGLRSEAFLPMDWEQVSWERGQLLIDRAYKRKEGRIAPYPKGKDWQLVPISGALREYLEALHVSRGKPKRGFICVGPSGEGMLSYHTLYKALRRLCRELGFKELAPHELRHTCSEVYQERGLTTVDLQRLFDHKDEATTRRYLHRTDERLANAVAGVNFPQNFPRGKKEAVLPPDPEAHHVH